MVKVMGVTKENWEIEKKLQLWDIPIVSLEQAHLIAKWFCKELNLENVNIIFGRGKKSYGLYHEGKNKIFLYQKGLNLATLVHELAHHYSYLVYNKGGHKRDFAQAHKLMLWKAEEFLVGFKGN